MSMGVYIKGMEIPPHCAACPIERLDDYGDEIVFYCLLNDGDTKQFRAKCRRPDCPLVPVPPHGDLISRETAKLYHSYLVDERTDIRVPAIPLSVLNVVPTIIPAEPAEEGQ